MGSAVTAVAGVLSGGNPTITGTAAALGGSGGGLLGGGNPLSTLAGIGGGAMQDLVKGIVPEVPIADQARLQEAIQSQQNLVGSFSGQRNAQQNLSNQQFQNAAQGVGLGQNAINQAQGAVSNAQNVNQGVGSNVNQAVGLLGETAAGGGAAQQAANAQLRAGTDEAIRTQQAMANSGNLSQMIGGQRAAMTNAGQLQQQNALNAAALQAGMAGTAQGQFAGAAGQQAGQAAQNAQLQQQQTAQQQGQTAQQADLANIAGQQAQGYAGQANTAQGNALTGQTNALGIQQEALGDTAKYRAQALGGMLNAGGGAMALASDKNLKQDIKSDPQESQRLADKKAGVKTISTAFSGLGEGPDSRWRNIPLSSDENGKEGIQNNSIKSFLDAIDPVSFEYKKPDGEKGKTEGTHLGVLAQQIEKAPGGASMVVEMPEGKGIDIPSAVGTLLAASASINSRMSDLEELFKSRKKK